MSAFSSLIGQTAPVQWYRLDDADGATALDQVGGTASGTINGAPDHQVTSIIPGDSLTTGLRTLTSGDWVSTTVPFDTATGWSIMVTLQTTDTEGIIFRTRSGNNSYLYIKGSSTNIIINVNNSGEIDTGLPKTEVYDGTPHLMVLQWNEGDGRVELWMDGARRYVGTHTTGIGTTAPVWYLAENSTYYNIPLAGTFHDWVFWDRALSEAENAQLYGAWQHGDASTVYVGGGGEADGGNATTTIHPALPGGVQSGDLMVLVGRLYDGSTTVEDLAPAVAQGWTVRSFLEAAQTVILDKIYVQGDVAPPFYGRYPYAQVFAFRGARASFVERSFSTQGSGSSANRTHPALVGADSERLVVAVASAAGWDAPDLVVDETSDPQWPAAVEAGRSTYIDPSETRHKMTWADLAIGENVDDLVWDPAGTMAFRAVTLAYSLPDPNTYLQPAVADVAGGKALLVLKPAVVDMHATLSPPGKPWVTNLLRDNPVGLWMLDEPAGSLSFADRSGNDNDATLALSTGAALWQIGTDYNNTNLPVDPPGELDGAFEHQNPTYLRTVELPQVTGVTYSFWFRHAYGKYDGTIPDYRTNIGNGTSVLCGRIDDNTTSMTVHIGRTYTSGVAPSDSISFYADRNGAWIGGWVPPGDQSILDGEWHHIVCVWDGADGQAVASDQFAIYIDGSAKTLTEFSTGSMTAPVDVGRLITFKRDYYSGQDSAAYQQIGLAQLAVYDRALPPDVAGGHVSAGLGVAVQPAVVEVGMQRVTSPYPDVVLADSPVVYLRLAEAVPHNSTTYLKNELDPNKDDPTLRSQDWLYYGNSQDQSYLGAVDLNAGFNIYYDDHIRCYTADLWSQWLAGSFTVEAWIKPEESPNDNTYRVLIYHSSVTYAPENSRVSLWWFNTAGTTFLRWQAGTSAAGYYVEAIGGEITVNEWNHVVLTWDSATLRGYINGDQVASSSVNAGAMASPSSAYMYFNGGYHTNHRYYHTGWDEIALYTYALSPAQIGNHYGFAQLTSHEVFLQPAVAVVVVSVVAEEPVLLAPAVVNVAAAPGLNDGKVGASTATATLYAPPPKVDSKTAVPSAVLTLTGPDPGVWGVAQSTYGAPANPGAVLRLFSSTDTVLGDIREYEELIRTKTRAPESGSIVLSVRRGTPGAELLDRDMLFARLVVGGVQQDDVYVLDTDSDDDRDADGDSRIIKATFPSIEKWFQTAVVYPETASAGETGNDVGGEGSRMFHKFADKNAGQVMKTFIDRAKARGALKRVTYDFTATHDSNGTAWTTDDEFDEAYSVGISYLQVLNALAGIGWCDYWFDGFTLQLFRHDTIGTDQTGVVLRRGREVQKGPRQRRRLGARTTMLVHGEDLALYEHTDPTAIANLERREGFYKRANVYQQGTITKLAINALKAQKETSEAITLTLSPDACPYTPGVDFDLWDYIYYDQRAFTSGELEPLRVNTITERWDSSGERLLEVEVLDRIADRVDRLTKLLERITQPDSPAPTLPDRIAPIPVIPPGGDTPTWPGYPDYGSPDFGDGGFLSGYGLIYVQASEPTGPVGTGWFDTDDIGV